jgi:3-oxoacyl-[acyl-carrier-protein] synthase-3
MADGKGYDFIKLSKTGGLKMDGLKIFNFGLEEVYPNIKEHLENLELSEGDIDYFVLHQANGLINDAVRKKLGVGLDKFPSTLDLYGNTSSASIPITMIRKLKNQLENSKELNLMLSGFGVGLSCGSMYLKVSGIKCPEIIEI